jgi:CMP-N,N'-diacetyllegionaminic acid synthase
LPKFFIHLRPTTPFRNHKVLSRIIRQFIKKQKKYSSLRSVSFLANPIYKSVIIKKRKLFSQIFKTFSLDRINNPRQNFSNSYMPNGYIDIIKTQSILNGYLHGESVMPYVNKGFVSDIDGLIDLEIAQTLIYDK